MVGHAHASGARWRVKSTVVETWPAGGGVVRLPDGRFVRGTGRRHARGDLPEPDFAVYLLSRDPKIVAWPYRWVRWPDFGLPRDSDGALAVLRMAYERAAEERVEIVCDGGTGRTGTAIAALAVFAGLDPGEAVAWVRSNYRPRAVETWRQRRWVRNLDPG